MITMQEKKYRDNLDKYIASAEVSILEALKYIDRNRKGFVLVIDGEGCMVGTLTDGDIRRAFIRGCTLEDKIGGVCSKNYKYLLVNDTLTSAIEIFKNEAIKFLPILDERSRLVNILTKSQMHALLLQDIHADFRYDFQSIDDAIVDHEIFQRPWGFYKTTLMNDYCQSKIICVYPGAQLSLQSHDHREEHWIIAHGRGIVQIGGSFVEAQCGNSFFIPKKTKHRLTNTDDKETLVVTEVQIGDYFGEDDIYRYEDIYGRV